MKSLFILWLLLLATLDAAAQTRRFNDAKAYGEWMMSYQEHPEPEALFSAFEFGITNKDIAESGSRNLIIAFFGSLFRADSTLIPRFYSLTSQKNTRDFHYGFTGALWMANTPYSRTILSRYLQLAGSKKYNNTGYDSRRPYDIYHDSISDASHLDLIWADFFATGNLTDIKRLASTLSANSLVAEAAQWSLISNGVHYKDVRQELLNQLANSTNPTLQQKLNTINAAIEGRLKK